jgi:hypothetical protein
MEKERDEFCEGPEAGADLEGLEARLGEKLVKRALWEFGRLNGGEVYGGVEDYDPVLRSHCRLD